MKTKEKTNGYTCSCGKFNEFTGWVYAHWAVPLQHACSCGKANSLHFGRVVEVPLPQASEVEGKVEGGEA